MSPSRCSFSCPCPCPLNPCDEVFDHENVQHQRTKPPGVQGDLDTPSLAVAFAVAFVVSVFASAFAFAFISVDVVVPTSTCGGGRECVDESRGGEGRLTARTQERAGNGPPAVPSYTGARGKEETNDRQIMEC